MRAVKSVLVAAGNLKKKLPNDDEYILLLRSICEVNVAKFFAFDLPLFEGITTDLFPGITVPVINYDHMYAAIEERLQARNLTSTKYFLGKII
jgi:dynein heavy chain